MDDSKLSQSQKERISNVWAYAREAGCLYTGWASPTCVDDDKFHYFRDAKSLCGKHEHFRRPQPDGDLNWVPNHTKIPVCKTCLKKYEQLKKEMNHEPTRN